MDKGTSISMGISALMTMSFLLALLLVALPMSVLGQNTLLSSDFAINVTSADDLVFTGLRNLPEQPSGVVKVNTAFVAGFPALQGTGLSGSIVKYGPNSFNAIHTHPRGSELLTLVSGTVVAGVIDTANRLFVKALYPGDFIIIPIGLLHFQINYSNETATAVAAFSNPSAGRVSVGRAIFNSSPHLDETFVEQFFQLDKATVDRLYNVAFPL